MTLRPEYTLGHSEFNAFLFSYVGQEASGQNLTVLSALARLDLDPWREAARLSKLPRDVATRAMAAAIGDIPGQAWTESDRNSIAAHLVGYLPTPHPRLGQTMRDSGDAQLKRKSWSARLLILVVLAVALFLSVSIVVADENSAVIPGIRGASPGESADTARIGSYSPERRGDRAQLAP